MAEYTVKDNLSGKTITFEWTGDNEPTEKDMNAIVAEGVGQKEQSVASKAKMYYNLYGKPMVEFGGMTAGAAVGAKTGAMIGAVGGPPGMAIGGAIGGLVGGTLGYGMAKKGSDIATGEAKGGVEGFEQSAEDLKTGAMMQGGGQASGPVISGAIKGVGAVLGPIWGRIMGSGKVAIEQAIKSGKDTGLTLHPFKTVTEFDKALRGKLTGEDIVDSAKSALNVIKENRSNDYVSRLSKITIDQTKLNNVKSQLDKTARNVADRFDIRPKYNDQGDLVDRFGFDKSSITEGQNTVKKALDDVADWSDTTVGGLDTLKKRLGDYVDQVKDGTPAQKLLVSIKDSLDVGIKRAVPEYTQMTKGYAELTKLIKDIESGLMLRKQGINGRVVADQTLRRLNSAMRDNFELRTDLVRVLGNQGGQDLIGQVAGHEMRSIVPKGLSGTGTAIGFNAAMLYLNPSFWPMVAASSPRVSAEFLRLFGKFSQSMAGQAGAVGSVGAYEALKESPKVEEQ